MARPGYVYIMANRRNGAIYIGSTSNLIQRAHQHREGLADGFTRRYGCKMLDWYEPHELIDGARLRELQMKKWKRLWKLSEIERSNPDWSDFFDTLF